MENKASPESAAFETAVSKAVQAQLVLYPLSSLKDIYKSFFQDEFGPGHLLEDKDMAGRYFKQELEEMQSRGWRSAELCGMGKQFCRVPLDLVRDGIIDEDLFFSFFLSGVSEFKIPSMDMWREKWDIIESILDNEKACIRNFDMDRDYIRELLNNGQYSINHSPLYRNSYDPHYRIMTVLQKNDLYSEYLFL